MVRKLREATRRPFGPCRSLLCDLGADARSGELEYDRVMHDPINSRGGGHRIFEDLIPFGEDQVRGDHHAFALISFGQQSEEDFHLGTIVLYVTDVIERNAVEVVEPLQFAGQSQIFLCIEQPLHQLYHGCEENRMAALEQRTCQCHTVEGITMKKCTKVAIWLCAAWAVLARAAPPLEVYGALSGVDQIRLSPSGQQFALFGVIDGGRKFAVFSFEGKPLLVMDMGTIKVRDLQWAGENHVLLTVSSTFKGPLVFTENVELDNVLNVNIAKRTARPIFYGHNQLPGAVWGSTAYEKWGAICLGTLAPSLSSAGGYGGFELSNANEDLYRIDLDSGDALRLVQGSELRRNWVMAPDGSLMAHSEYNEHDGVWKLYAGPGAGRMVIQRLTPLHSIGLIGLGRGPGTVLVGDNTGIQDVVEEVSIADGKVEPLFAEVTTEAYLHDRGTYQLIGAIVREEPKAQFFDQVLLARFRATRKAFPGFTVSLISYSQGLQRMVVKTEGGDDSGTYWTVDIASGKASPVGYPYPAIRPADVGESRAFHYAASDGLDIEAILTLPPGKQATGLPLVVMLHGGPIRVSDEVGFDWWAQAYASRGYAVIQPNYRGSSGYGRAFVEAAFGQWGRKMQTDLSGSHQACEGWGDRSQTGLYCGRKLRRLRSACRGDAAAGNLSLRRICSRTRRS
jgi:hypothetical protein